MPADLVAYARTQRQRRREILGMVLYKTIRTAWQSGRGEVSKASYEPPLHKPSGQGLSGAPRGAIGKNFRRFPLDERRAYFPAVLLEGIVLVANALKKNPPGTRRT
jgi:hypothetical protein